MNLNEALEVAKEMFNLYDEVMEIAKQKLGRGEG